MASARVQSTFGLSCFIGEQKKAVACRLVVLHTRDLFLACSLSLQQESHLRGQTKADLLLLAGGTSYVLLMLSLQLITATRITPGWTVPLI